MTDMRLTLDEPKTPFNDDLHAVRFPVQRPELTIKVIGASAPFRCVTYTNYEIVSRVELDADDLARLDACGLLGFGQAYDLMEHGKIQDEVKPATFDKRTGAALPDVPPMNIYSGEPYTRIHTYEYFRYVVRRVCDSGD
ncbi:MAG TPA: hypothetical protein VM531_09040 [Sphingomicrobium sp.]|jgi:hypothetical protein|nr:hypothetical protein [Sphingomicrobium sp.]